MTRLYLRRYELQIGTRKIRDLSVGFRVAKSVKREPNTAEITVRNLSREHRREIEQARGLRVQLAVGYQGVDLHTIFRGDIQNAATPRGGYVTSAATGAEIETSIEAMDGGRSYTAARVSRSFAPGTPVVTVLGAAVDAMGIGRGNLADFASSGLEGAGSVYREGATLSGPAVREVDGIVRSMGLRWSVQNGVFQLLRRGRPLEAGSVRLAEGTGLIGAPAVDANGDVTATALIIPGLDPGRKIVLDSETISGGFEVRRVEYEGETRGDPWYAQLTLRRY